MHQEATAYLFYGYSDRSDLQEALYHTEDEVYKRHGIATLEVQGEFSLITTVFAARALFGRMDTTPVDPSFLTPAVLSLREAAFEAFFKEVGVQNVGRPGLFLKVYGD